MACDTFRMRDGSAFIVCTRKRRPRPKPCSTPGCSGEGSYLCDFRLTGKRAGKTCDRAICSKCRRVQPAIAHCSPVVDSFDFCPAHDELTRSGSAGEQTALRFG